jgi:DNA-binding CsgD family transcriptional regulator
MRKRSHDTLSRRGVVFTNLLSNGLDALFLLGRWEQVAQLAAHTSPPEHAVFCQVSLQVHRAALDTAQGRFAQAHTHLDGGSRIVAFSVRKDLFAEWCVASADLHLWEGDPYAAQQIVADVMTELTAGNYALPLARLLATGARAEADLALAGAERRSLAETVAALPDRASMAPLATAYLTMAAAELARIDDHACAETWALAAKHWARLCCPYFLAYARWRQAEALLAGRGRRRAATAALAESHRTATRLGAVPLAQETLRLAVRARLDLADAPDGAGGPVPERLTAVGLTDRETDVLRLLAEGRTNRQIARSLFISESTVSIHVSRVLSKLGARNRTTAVTTAHRMGLLPPPKAG